MTNIQNRNVLVTGGAGFIGSHLVDYLLGQNNRVVVLDNFNKFYNPAVKRHNIIQHLKNPNYQLTEGDLRSDEDLERVFAQGPFDVVVHLAAMAGVRPSLIDPAHYMDVNVTGTEKLLKHVNAQGHSCKFVFGSSSSVYGKRSGERFSESDRIDEPLSPYAASKISGELSCYTSHYNHGLPVVCLRFFTVFGPRQRPDLAIHKFAKLIEAGQPIEMFGDGTSKRDYTFVADIISGITKAMEYKATDYEIINLGRGEPVYLKDMIGAIEEALGKKASIIKKPFEIADMPYTYADISKARQLLGYEPQTTFVDGIKQFVNWHSSLLDMTHGSPA